MKTMLFVIMCLLITGDALPLANCSTDLAPGLGSLQAQGLCRACVWGGLPAAGYGH